MEEPLELIKLNSTLGGSYTYIQQGIYNSTLFGPVQRFFNLVAHVWCLLQNSKKNKQNKRKE